MTNHPIESRLRSVERLLARTAAADRHRLRRISADIRRQAAAGRSVSALDRRLSGFEQKVQRAVRRRQRRAERMPRPNYNTALPIYARRDEIVEAISSHPVTIISGETGSGKTTQIPQFCLEAGKGVDGWIGCTQPRRIAAVTVAQRIAEEIGVEDARVAHKVRFSDTTGKKTVVKIMTDGILLAEARSDPLLGAYETIIVDEAHERSLNIDFILGMLKTLLSRRRDLTLIVTSATIDTEKFSRAFDGAPVLEVSGRLYPVEVRYREEAPAAGGEETTPVEEAAAAAERLYRRSRRGDILIFMPTEQDIRETCEHLQGKRLAGSRVLPLFARLPAGEQHKIFQQGRGRKIVVATNVAETSITIPGIRYVVDTGLARIPRYLPRSRTTAMPVVPVSRSSADQRAGRCGRVENGVCQRLFSEQDYLNRPRFTPPEILRANLAEVILRMIDLNLGDIERFPFIDPPSPASISDGYRLLTELGAIAEDAGPASEKARRTAARYRLTRRGHLMASLPLDPRLSRMLIEAEKEGCIEEILVIAAALSIADPRERPADRAAEADAAHRRFHHPASDFLTLLRIWNAVRRARSRMGTGRLKRYCREHFLSFSRMREWRDLHAQLREEAEEAGLAAGGKSDAAVFDDPGEDRYAAVHRAIVSGFLSGIGARKEKQFYQAARGRQAMLFPGSALFEKPPEWIVAAEMVETSRLFARTAARIDSRWLEALGGGLCRRTFLHPRWDPKRGQVVATEQVSLFGLIIVEGRTVSYGRVDPPGASDIFVRSALVEERIRRPFAFMDRNRDRIERIRKMEDKLRRRDLLASDEAVFAFYRERVPKHIWDLKGFARYLKEKGGGGFLEMSEADLLLERPDTEALSRFPDRFEVEGRRFALDYRFAPGEAGDGVTVRIPASEASAVPPAPLEWLVPGLLKEKITALIRGLPKAYRRHLVPVGDTVETVMKEMPKADGALVTALGEFVYRRFGLEIPASAWPSEELPDHLKMRIAVVGHRGEELRSGRDPALLAEAAETGREFDALKKARKRWERGDIEDWDFGDLPEEIPLGRPGQLDWSVYPGLQVHGGGIRLRLFQDRVRAAAAHRAGVAALYRKRYAADVKYFRRQIAFPGAASAQAAVLGGAKHLEGQIFEKTYNALFAVNIRSAAEFSAHREKAAAGLFRQGQQLLAAVLPVVAAVADARSALSDLERASRERPQILGFIGGIRSELSGLIPENFVALYDEKRLSELPRYASALVLRARRGVEYPEKDRVKAEAVQPFAEGLTELLGGLSRASTAEKRAAVEDFFWLLQEYKVSVFAQELGTAVPVSRKRMEKRLSAVRRMG